MTTLMQASHQWMSRPVDQRFVSLPELHKVVSDARHNSIQRTVSTRRIEVQPHAADPKRGITIEGESGMIDPTHWSFGQLASLAGAPASYLRTLPAPLVADAMNYGLRFNRDAEDVKLLSTQTTDDNGVVSHHASLRAATGPNYGRVWNEEIVGALMNKFGDGRTGDFRVPGEFGKEVPITRDNTTIYGSDRDIFIFLADETNRMEVGNRRNGQPGSLARGFFVWNSEEGSKSIGAAFFLFDYVCMNRIVWGVQDFKEIRLRHTAGAPDRWLEEISPVLMEYSKASALPIEATIKEAQQKRVDDDLDKFLANRFTKSEAKAIQNAHLREEGRPIETVWDAVTGVTAHAKTIPHQDARVDMERKGGNLLDLVAV
ncbi:DUF932 domain-containing protein [Synechococcus virus S-ESS1]|uniref:DUF932 domain-containing protein n=1 Tax=Synechococcus virus S-ESS1 TaxID=1964565 RepID=A0A1V0DX75_9CAUD|nr:DUF932 domain-containing protein [Synechococcus virus S-ESS1]ARB05727.1 DUF932 domain-containing protein [Synechococcus virus S-ESS1]